MIKRSLKAAMGIAVGTTIGGVIIPRLFLFSHLYNQTFPTIFMHSVLYLAGSYVASFIAFLLIEWVKVKIKL